MDDVVPLSLRIIRTDSTAPNPVSVDAPVINSSTSGRGASAIDSDRVVQSSWVEQYSQAELQGFQLKDPDLSKLIGWIETEEEVAHHELWLASPAVKHLWQCRSQLEIQDGILLYEWLDFPEKRLCFVVPNALKEDVLKAHHDVRLAGHLGPTKTLQRLKHNFFWHNMSHDCEVYVKSCHLCSKSKKPKQWPRAGLGKYHVGSPLERVHLDILGPFVKSTAGNIYVLMIVDQFTKWLECYPLPDQSTETIAEKFVQEFVSKLSSPLQVHTDQGRNFDGNLFQAICDLLEISKSRTPPYRPCSNGQVERYNRTLLQCIRCSLQRSQKDWDKDIPLLAGAI